MEDKKETEIEQPKRFTYEQLQQIADNLSIQVQQLNARLQQANMVNLFKRLDYCLEVIKISSSTVSVNLFNPEFVERCIKEVEDLMTPPEDNKEETDK